MNPEQILESLNDSQREAVTTVDGPVLIKAGPGTGKTRTITHRIAYAAATGVHDPRRTLALTFTTRAAGELRRRLRDLDADQVTVRTFHSAALRQMRHFWPEAIGGTPARVEPDRRSLMAAAAARLEVPDDSDTVSGLLTELDWLKATGHTVGAYHEHAQQAQRDLGVLDVDAAARALAEYEVVKSERGVIDFDDVLLITIGLLDARTDLREGVRRAFRWFTVDEYQDVSPLQQRLLDLWVGGRDQQQLCAVGDAAQAIYAFAGADPSLMSDFPRRYPGAAVLELERTYRCSGVVTEAANRLAHRIPGAVRLRPREGVDRGSVQVLQFPSDGSEAAGIADEVAALISRGDDPSGIACLFRTNHQGRVLQDELRRRRIPFSSRGSERYYDRAEVKEAVVRLRGEIHNDPSRPVTDSLAAVLVSMGHDAEPPDSPRARDRWESLASLCAMVERDGDVAAPDVLCHLEERIAEQDPPAACGVSVLTIHAAKGLEWDTVFIAGAADGQLPSLRARTDDARQEEQRVAYVGFTRAGTRLVVSWATRGTGGDRRSPSPFIAAIQSAGGDHVVALPATGASSATPGTEPDSSHDHAGEGRPPARCRVCDRALVTGVERVLGRCETCPSSVDSDVLTALTRWRDHTADREGLPGHAILTDIMLLAIAEQQPDSIERMGQIPGVRPDKVARFGTQLLTVMHSAPVAPPVAEPVDQASGPQ